MTTENVLPLLPPRARKAVYILYGLTGLAGVFLGAFYLASPYEVPWWLTAGLAGLGALSPAFSTLAASNVKPTTPEPGPPEVEPQPYYDRGDADDLDPHLGSP